MAIPLRLGRIAPDLLQVRRSGFRWHCADGHSVLPGQVIAFCNIGLRMAHAPDLVPSSFRHEQRDFQVAIVAAIAGRVRARPGISHGGQMDQLEFFLPWDPEQILADIEPAGPPPPDATRTHRILFAVGRRFTEYAEVRAGLLTGWHDRHRAWWGDGDKVDGTLLSMGSCELTALITGDRPAFLDLLGAVPGTAQVVSTAADLLVPCARVCLEQMRRTQPELDAIAEDMASTMPRHGGARPAEDWYFGATLLAELQHSPMTEGCDALVRPGVQQIPQPDAIIMSLIAEPRRIFRHRRLGYCISMHDFRIGDASPAMRDWMRAWFEPVDRDIDDIREDWRALIAHTRQAASTLFLALNVSTSSANEDFLSYAQFDAPMARTVTSVRSKELNLMLHDLAQEPGLAIVDADAIVAEVGAALHQPDGVHMSGPMQHELRQEVLHQLRRHQVPGFR